MKKDVKKLFLLDIWMIRSCDLPKAKRVSLSVLRVLFLTGKLFIRNKCSFKASSLTFLTLFSFVPVAALVFGIAQGCGFSDLLEEKLKEALSLYPAIAEKLIAFTQATLSQAKGGLIAGAGVFILIWTTIKLLSNIENTINEIWGIHRSRSFVRKITDYIAITIICPILLLAAGSGLVAATTRVGYMIKSLPGAENIIPVFGLLTKGVPFLSIWLVLSFIYIVIPNTKVKFVSALTAAFFTAAAYILLQIGYIYAQFMMVSYNTIYGSFAAIPLLLLWLNLSWNLILAGAQLTFSIQNVSEFEMLPGDEQISTFQRNAIALEFTCLVCERFQKGLKPFTEDELSLHCQVPIRMTRKILAQLVKGNVFTEGITPEDPMIHTYQAARPVEQLTPVFVISAIENADGASTPLLANDSAMKKYSALLAEAGKSKENSFHKK